MLRIRRPNLSPTFTTSPAAIGWSQTIRSSSSSHDLSNLMIAPGTSSRISCTVCFCDARFTDTGTCTLRKLRA